MCLWRRRKRRDVDGQQDGLLLGAGEEPPAHIDARRRLERADLDVGRIVNVYPDAVLYVDSHGRAWTAWCRSTPAVMPAGMPVIKWRAEPGFRIEPGPYIDE